MTVKTKRTRKWQWVTDRGFQARFMLDNGERRIYSNAHCICCALVSAMTQYGGEVDLRGLHSHGICYQFLCIVVRASRDPEPEEEEE